MLLSEPDVVTGALALQQSYSSVADEIPCVLSSCSNPVYSTYAEIEELPDTKGDKPDKIKLSGKSSINSTVRELPAKPSDAKDDTQSSLYFEIDDADAKDAKTEKGDPESKNKRNHTAVPAYMYKKKLSNASNIYAECEDVSTKDTKSEKPYMDMTKKTKDESEYVPQTKDAETKKTVPSKLSKDQVNFSKRSRNTDKGSRNQAGKTNSKVLSTVNKINKGQIKGQVKSSLTSDSDSDDDIVVENELYEPFESAKV